MTTYAAMKPTKPGLEEPQEQIHKIRITLSSKHVKNLEKGRFFFVTEMNVLFEFSKQIVLYALFWHWISDYIVVIV